jgi:hypothetical protein
MKNALGLGLLIATACTGDEGTGSVRVSLSGEEASLTGYPVDLGGGETIAFEDGWTAQFTHVLVSLSGFTLATSDGESQPPEDAVVADLHLGMPQAWEMPAVPAQRWDRVSYRIAPPPADARVLDGVDAGLVTTMRDNGWSMLMQGTAQNGAESVTFSLGFPIGIQNNACHSGFDDTDGLVVANGAMTDAEVTIHLDHLFFDTYALDEAALRFEPYAAVADASGHVTLDALAMQELASPVDRAGATIEDVEGNPVVYDPGPLDLTERNLRGYVIAAATTVGHFNGEGHCDYVVQ